MLNLGQRDDQLLLLGGKRKFDSSIIPDKNSTVILC